MGGGAFTDTKKINFFCCFFYKVSLPIICVLSQAKLVEQFTMQAKGEEKEEGIFSGNVT